jgi:hypothetical protein
MRESRMLTRFPLPLRERKGPIAEQWEGEGDVAATRLILRQPPHPPRYAGPLPLPRGAREKVA